MVQLSPLKFNIHQISKRCLDDLINILNGIPGTRHILILEKSLTNKLNLLTPFNIIKERGNILSVLWLEDEISSSNNLNSLNLNSFVIVCNNDIQNTELIDKKVKELILINSNFKISGIIIDEVTKGFEFRLEQLGVKGEIQLHSWDLKPSILDEGLLSLELFQSGKTNAIKDLYLKNINQSVFKLSKSLLNLTNLFPTLIKFNNILIKGNKSTAFYEIFQNLRNEYLSSLNPVQRKQEEMFEKANYLNASLNSKPSGRSVNGSSGSSSADQFVDLIVLERGLDFVTPLMNQLTYLGLVDEFYDFESNIVNLPKDIVIGKDASNATDSNHNGELPENASVDNSSNGHNDHSKPKSINKVNFNYREDEILQRIKDLNFAAIGPILNDYAKSLQAQFDARHNAKRISEVKEFVGKLSGLQKQQFYLRNHTVLAENILAKVKGSSPANDDGTGNGNLQILDEDEEEDNERLFSQMLELQQGILDNYYDYKRATEMIINMIYNGLGCIDTFRLCCLLSKVKNGVNEKNYNLLKGEIILNFGIKHLVTLQNLKKMKLFYIKESFGATSYLLPAGAIGNTSNTTEEDVNEIGAPLGLSSISYVKDFSNIKKYLNLTPNFDESELANRADDPENPIDASFAFANYVPITTRLIQSAYDRSFMDSSLSSYLSKSSSWYLSKSASWKGVDDLWRFLIGEVKETTFFEILGSGAKPVSGASSNPGGSLAPSPSATSLMSARTAAARTLASSEQSLCFVVMIGGITYGEIATLRYIEKQLRSKGVNKKFVILTEGIVNGSRIIEAAIPEDINDC